MGEICPKAAPPLTKQKKVPRISEGPYFPESMFHFNISFPRNIPSAYIPNCVRVKAATKADTKAMYLTALLFPFDRAVLNFSA